MKNSLLYSSIELFQLCNRSVEKKVEMFVVKTWRQQKEETNNLEKS